VRQDGKSLPVAGGSEVKQTHGDKGDNPKSDDEGADREDDSAHAAVFGMGGSSFANAEDLPEKSDDEDDAAENDC